MGILLSVKNLSIDFKTADGTVHAVQNLSFEIPRGKTVGLVGESGSGKSVTSLAIMGLIEKPAGQIPSGKIIFEKEDLLKYSEKAMRSIRGNEIAMIFQEPMTSLNPVFRVGYQIEETLKLHENLPDKERKERVIELLKEVGLKDPEKKVRAYPHQLSGGQRQRVMIAMAIACNPKLLIADEPTTALDVTIQKQILDLLAQLQEKYKMSILFITHDLAVVGDIADEVVVMYKGKLVEHGYTQDIFMRPQHPYTKGLLNCRPDDKKTARLATINDFMDKNGNEKAFDASVLGEAQSKPMSEEVVLEVKNLGKYYPLKTGFFGQRKEWFKAVDDVSFKVNKGRTLGLVGESGCGKTTLGRTILRLMEPNAGQIYFKNQDITKLKDQQLRALRKKMQIVFQDPYASLNPRMTVGTALMEPMKVHGIGGSGGERKDEAEALMEKVGLDPRFLKRYPHEFSGGQRQRICIARALSVKPEFIICDESVSALDVSVQAQILNLLLDLQEEMGLTYIFISHDLAVVRFFSDEVAVMNEGKIVEFASAEEVYTQPKNAYTKNLLAAIPQGRLKVHAPT